jgi:rSAM/selenodomain-associated transferase 2
VHSDKLRQRKSPKFLSIIVPVLNEAPLISPFLLHARVIAPQAEIIVVDGGSLDDTAELAAPLADRVLVMPRGRAAQMNAGAAIAQGDVIWFLHVDSTLPVAAVADIARLLQNPRITGGCFRLRIQSERWIYRISDSLGNVGVDLFRLALGDHGIFCRRAAFRAIKGYREVPILEDAELYRKLRRTGRVQQLPTFIISSPRAYEKSGPIRTTVTYFAILVLYLLGARIETLYAMYRRLHHREEMSA